MLGSHRLNGHNNSHTALPYLLMKLKTSIKGRETVMTVNCRTPDSSKLSQNTDDLIVVTRKGSVSGTLWHESKALQFPVKRVSITYRKPKIPSAKYCTGF